MLVWYVLEILDTILKRAPYSADDDVFKLETEEEVNPALDRLS
jgi:hypothetical protein